VFNRALALHCLSHGVAAGAFLTGTPDAKEEGHRPLATHVPVPSADNARTQI